MPKRSGRPTRSHPQQSNAREAGKLFIGAKPSFLPNPTHLLLRCEMLLFLLFVHLLSKNGGAAPILNPLEPRTTCDDINNCRKLFDVVWGCLATIFACTWVSVHPNVPPPGQSWLALLWRRLKMMLIAVVAPEIMVGFAARQFFHARELSRREPILLPLNFWAHSIFVDFGFSKTHGFFLCMGGFVSSTGYPVTTMKQLNDPVLGEQFLAAIRAVEAEDIMDKSKGDALSKGLALAQGLWFTTQCLARVQQQLAVTQLEVATLAFAVVNVFIWVLWWGKPLDVQRPIVVGPPDVPETEGANVSPRVHLKVWEKLGHNVMNAVIGSLDTTKYISTSSSSVPTFWSFGRYEFGDSVYTIALLFETLVGTIFGAIHCTSWNTDFPTTAETWIWRSSSLSVTTIPVTIVMVLGLTLYTEFSENVAVIACSALTSIYVLARISLLVLPFMELRSLPPGAFVDVNWSVYLPHL